MQTAPYGPHPTEPSTRLQGQDDESQPALIDEGLEIYTPTQRHAFHSL